jgi:hypothetical protein
VSDELADLQKKFTDLHAISIQMAQALRLAVMTEFPEERLSAEAKLRQRI